VTQIRKCFSSATRKRRGATAPTIVRRSIGIIVNCHYERHSFCPRENLLSWTDVVQRRRLLSLCALRESRVVPHISWPRERNMRSRLKSETRRTGTNLVAHFSFIYRTRDGTTGKQISHQAAKTETLYSVKSECQEKEF